MSYNLLCKLFGRTFWSHICFANMCQASQICGNYSITCSASYLVIHLLMQIYDNYSITCFASYLAAHLLRKYVAIIVTVAVLLPVSGSPVSERKYLPD